LMSAKLMKLGYNAKKVVPLYPNIKKRT